MSRIFIDQPLTENSTVTLTGDDHHYIKNVLRMKKGDPLFLFNGGEKEFKARISEIEKNKTFLHITDGEITNKESTLEIMIAQGIPKGQKMDDLIPKITELGASGIIPLITDRSDIKTASSQKITRWKKIAKESSEQTGRTKVPTIFPPMTLNEILHNYSHFEKIVFYELENAVSFQDILDKVSKKQFLLIIGPEGGFSPKEIAMTQEKACNIVSLGKRILRTQTVAPAVCAILQYVKGDLNVRPEKI